MGLFDIFRRRNAEETASADSETTGNVEAASTSALESATSVVSDSGTESDVIAESNSASTSTSLLSESAASEMTARQSVAASLSVAASAADSQQAASTEQQNADSLSVAAEDALRQSTSASISTSASEATRLSTASLSESTSTSISESESDVEDTASSEVPATDAELYDKGLEKSRKTFGDRLNEFLANFRSVDEDFFDDLEETLIGADVGFNTAVSITDELRDEVRLQNAKKRQDVENVIVEKLVNRYDQEGDGENNSVNMAKSGPTVIFFVGVNGVGKTTTVGKLANMYKQQGKKVLLAAADTFRAGAIEQLQVWGKRDDVPVVALPEKSDPAAVVYDAVQRAKNENFDILMVDTAGRLQNKVNLMNELAKMKRVLSREIPDAPHEVLLVLDATTGQNALNQAKTFGEATAVTGIVLTKLDGTAKGGIVLAIRNEMHLPVKFVGLGEQVNDLRPFDPNEFVYGLFKGLIKE
ncbi:signal recognition particle-docking protein FtsY [Furfurilactobacillus siliginis]|uniref:Signal recognition particle receptor FtsY n=1 Tax=Furfurilactobacillus siliginis TaxID=348151 RepID=A0A0R2LD52_9LACO|nr:signal recognition particle-docking protein FtsY [Furfurilactobacillus siliginis]KRN96906.1 Signal recognition particle GTPase [Furfurilactobacillus siliginis]GEK28102.1 signal recognition particle receptor FtsY [Furfurilactobacillus siliginis]